jgi:dipeptidyl aminopeptidase/acylaminoacyl peptidase
MSETSRNEIESLAELPTVAHPVVSPDGEEIALYFDTTGRHELYLLDPESGELTQLSDGEVPRDVTWGPGLDWSADGSRVYFHRDEAGNEAYDIYGVDRDGAVESVVEMDARVTLADVGEDGEQLLLTANPDGPLSLFRHDIVSGETTELTEYERSVRNGTLSPSGDRIAYTTNETDDHDNRDIYVAAADGSEPRRLDIGTTGSEASVTDWHPDGERLLVGDNTTDTDRCGVYDLTSDEVTWFENEAYVENPKFFLPDGKRFLAHRVRGPVDAMVVYDIETGECREFNLPDGVTNVRDSTPLADGRLAVLHRTPTRRRELLAYDLETDDSERLLVPDYGPFTTEDFGDAIHFQYESDGVPEAPARAVEHDPYETLEIDALLYDSGERPSPLVVMPHGGPAFHDRLRFDYRVQFLLQRGYSVLQVNYRGSTGRGRAFTERLHDDWGGAEQGDIATGVEYVLDEHGWLDEDRVVVYGGSYGGYSALWQLLQFPALYAGGVAWVAVSDLEDMYENTIPHFRAELMGKYLGRPEDNPERYEERSPTTHVENLDAPLLIVHGVNDPRVPISQARLLREELSAAGFEAGRDFEYEELGDEGHGSADIDHKKRSLRLLAEFLDQRIEPTVDTAVEN